MKKPPRPKAILNLDLTPEGKAALEELATKANCSMIEVIRKAMSLFEVVTDFKDMGKLVFEHNDGTREVLRIL